MKSTELKQEAASQQPSHVFDLFLSYSRKDKDFASRLENALESYKYPKSLKRAKRNLNVFRDESDIQAAEDYHRTIEQHLAESAKLVVVCSPDARKSRYVADEINRFMQTHSDQDIIPVLIRGKANNETTDESEMAFPEVMCENRMPLAANFLGCDTHKGKLNKGPFRSSFYSLVAAISGTDRRALEQIDEKARARRRAMTLSVATAIIVILSVALVFAVISQRKAVAATAEATRSAKAEEKAKNEALTYAAAEKIAKDQALASAAAEKIAKDQALASAEAEKKAKNEAVTAANAEEKAKKEAIVQRDAAQRTAAEASAEAALARNSGNEAIAWLHNTSPTFDNVARAISAVQKGLSWRLWQIGDWRESGLVRWSPNGQLLAYAAYDDSSVWVTDVRNGRIRAIPRRPEVGGSSAYQGISELSWSTDSRYLAWVAADNVIEIWAESNERVQRSSGYPVKLGPLLHKLAWSKAGELLHADAQGSIQVFKVLADGLDLTPILNTHDLIPHGEISRMVWSPDADRLALAATDGSVWMWERNTQVSQLVRASTKQAVLRIVWSPNGKILLATDADGALTFLSGSDFNSAEVFVAIPSEGESPGSEVPLAIPNAAYKAAADEYERKIRESPGTPVNNLTLAERQGRLAVDAVWSPDGNTLAMVSSGGAIWFLDLQTRVQRKLGSGMPPLRWSPSGLRLACQGSEGILRLWDLQPRLISGLWPAKDGLHRDLRAADRSLAAIEWSADDRSVVTASPLGAVQIWDAQSEPGIVIEGLTMERPNEVAWSNTGRFLAIRSFEGGELDVWDRTNGRIRRFTDLIAAWRPPITWSSTQSVLALPTKQGVILYNADQDRVEQLDSYGKLVHSLRWSRDGTQLLGASDTSLIVWDIRSRRSYIQATSRPTQQSRLWSLDWSPDGTTAVVAQSDGTLFFWFPRSGETKINRRDSPEPEVHRLDWITNRIIILDRNDFSIEFRDIQLDANLNETEPDQKGFYTRHVGGLSSYSWSPRRKWLAIGSRLEATVETFDLSLRQVSNWQGHRGNEVATVLWSPDGTVLASGGGGSDIYSGRGTPDYDVRIWEPATGKSLVLSGHREKVWGLAWSPDGTLLASSADDGTVRVWQYPIGMTFKDYLTNRTNVSTSNGHILVKQYTGLPWAHSPH